MPEMRPEAAKKQPGASESEAAATDRKDEKTDGW
jgi:hypothetical protein